MNIKLTKEITYHILANLGVFSSDFINLEQTQSILDKKYLLPQKLQFVSENDSFEKNIYGCQKLVSDKKEFKILLADCAQSKNLPEFAVLIQLKDSPMFGLYSIFSDSINSEAMIAVNTDGKYWIPCNTYLQATFLAGMEQIKDLVFGWEVIKDYEIQYTQLLNFISFHENYFGDGHEGQKV